MSDLLERMIFVKEIMKNTPDPLYIPFNIAYRFLEGQRYAKIWQETKPKEATLYVHIPLCLHKCKYCMLFSKAISNIKEVERYAHAIIKEIELVSPIFKDTKIRAVHFGGGTWSVLSPQLLERILVSISDSFHVGGETRLGIEFHPSSTTRKKLEVLSRFGFSRLSFGIQTFTQTVLDKIGRGYQTKDKVFSVIKMAKEIGIKAINIDLLAGLPFETLSSFQDSIRHALELEVESITINRFLVEHTQFFADEYINPQHEILTDQMLILADEIIRNNRPPISPSLPVTQSIYGIQYIWQETHEDENYFQEDMMGPNHTIPIGHGGMGHIVGKIFSFAYGDLKDYCCALEENRLPDVLACKVDDRFEMSFFLAHRITCGKGYEIDFCKHFNIEVSKVFKEELDFLEKSGYLLRRENLYKPINADLSPLELFAFLLFDNQALKSNSYNLHDFPIGCFNQYRMIRAELPLYIFWCRIALAGMYANERYRSRG